MKNIYLHIDKAFENKVRLSIMGLLMLNEWIDFNRFKEILMLTDGNLASHLLNLEKINYISVKKEFVGKKTKTSYAATSEGKLAFKQHLNALEAIIKNSKIN